MLFLSVRSFCQLRFFSSRVVFFSKVLVLAQRSVLRCESAVADKCVDWLLFRLQAVLGETGNATNVNGSSMYAQKSSPQRKKEEQSSKENKAVA